MENITPYTPKAARRNINNIFTDPILARIGKESKEEYSEMQTAFSLMGWDELPDSLKIEIYEDVRFMVAELKGLYSSCDPYIEKRRNSVHYWVSCFMDGISSLETVTKALKVKAL